MAFELVLTGEQAAALGEVELTQLAAALAADAGVAASSVRVLKSTPVQADMRLGGLPAVGLTAAHAAALRMALAWATGAGEADVTVALLPDSEAGGEAERLVDGEAEVKPDAKLQDRV